MNFLLFKGEKICGEEQKSLSLQTITVFLQHAWYASTAFLSGRHAVMMCHQSARHALLLQGKILITYES